MTKVCILSISRIADDPRVRRQGDTLSKAGCQVLAVGIAGGISEPPTWRIEVVEEPQTQLRRVATATRGAVGRLGAFAARVAFWTSPMHRRIYALAKEFQPDLVIANDWKVLPIAARLANSSRASVHYDSHEYAIEQRADSLMWRTMIAPFVRQIEGGFIDGAESVSTVCDGIADAMHRRYQLRQRPTVIRNTPEYQRMTFRQTRDPVRVLFHGGLLPNRGLHELIKSVPAWEGHLALTIRGPAEASFRRSLEQSIEEVGESHRIELLGPAPMTELISLANVHDIGIFAPAVLSEHLRFALPNKLFEYMMAGLCVVSTDLPEIARIVNSRGVGVLIENPVAAEIAATMNSLTSEKIDAAKQNSLRAAKELCWEREQERLLEVLGLATG